MRTLLFLYAFLTLLSGCSKDNGPSAAASAESATGTCPALEGTYAGHDHAGQLITFSFTTVREGNKTSYAYSDHPTTAETALPADGSTFTGTTEEGLPVEMRMSCGANSLVIRTKFGAEPHETLTFTNLGGNQIHAETNGEKIVLVKQ